MSGSRHTPGLCAPWGVDDFSGTIIWGTGADGNPIRIADVRGWGSLTGLPYLLSEEAAAAEQDKWANLIAAAPDLLEALKALVRVNEEHNAAMGKIIKQPVTWKDTYLDAARAAIAKAEGRDP